MKIIFQMIAFNSDAVLDACLESIAPYGEIIVTEGAVKFWRDRGFTTSTDRTNEILSQHVPKENIVHGSFPEKDDMMNAAIHLIPDDVTHVWMVDCDEIWTSESIERVLARLRLDDFDSVAFKPVTFFGGFDHVMGGFEERFTWYRIQRWYPGARWATHRPPTINAPDGVSWANHWHWDCEERFYHYSYVFPDAVKAKAEYYASRGGTIPQWFERIWLPWVLGNPKERSRIENNFDGVHEWIPMRRGDARTRPFAGEHPLVIQKRMPELQARFERELTKHR